MRKNKNIKKKCLWCMKDKNIDLFSIDKTRSLGRSDFCIACTYNCSKRDYEIYSLYEYRKNLRKVCLVCGTEKSGLDFSVRWDCPTMSIVCSCKSCSYIKTKRIRSTEEGVLKLNKSNSKYKKKKQYGLTEDQYQDLIKSNPTCAICGSVFTNKNYPCIDHDHTTGKVRGVLCSCCNWAIGSAKDDPKIIKEAIRYLMQFKGMLMLYETPPLPIPSGSGLIPFYQTSS